jgi:hypothetical protein
MSLTKVSYSMITGATVNVLDYGAFNDNTNAANTASAAIICNTGTTITSAGAIAATGTITFSATYFV